MSKLLVALLAAGAAAAAGYAASQYIKGKNSGDDYDDMDYDDDSFEIGGDGNIDFEINDDTVKEAVEDVAEEAEEAVEEAAEDVAEAVEEAAEDVED